MKVSGRYKKDSNFIMVYTGNRIYTIARRTREWSFIEAGQQGWSGPAITQADIDRLAGECEAEGSFNLHEIIA